MFTFFMITDPKTIPESTAARRVYAVGIGLLSTLLMARQTTEFGTKVALLGALTLVCGARPLLEWAFPDGRFSAWVARAASRGRVGAARVGVVGVGVAAAFAGLLVLVGLPARPSAASAAQLANVGQLPPVTIVHSSGVSSQLDHRTALVIAGDLIADLRTRADALRLRNAAHASAGVSGAVLADVQLQIRSAQGREIVVPTYRIDRMSVKLQPGVGQGPPTIAATVAGVVQHAVYTGSPPTLARQDAPAPFTGTFELGQGGPGYVILNAPGVTPGASVPPVSTSVVTVKLGGLRLHDVAQQVGLNFRQDSFRFGMSNDVGAMMGGGLCWLDYNNDGWEDLFVVNSYSDNDVATWAAHGGLPRSALFENVKGKFVDVSRRSHADLAVKGDGCVAADFNGDGYTDLLVTTTDGVKLLWNNGNGTFTEGARAAGMNASGWYTGAAVADVNGDGRPDVFVAGYTDLNDPIPGSTAGFPTNDAGVRDLLYLNEGTGYERSLAVPRGRRAGGSRGGELRTRPRSGVHGLQRRRAARPLRRERRGSESAVRERRLARRCEGGPGRARLPLRAARGGRGRRRPVCGDGDRGRRLQRRRPQRPVRDQLPSRAVGSVCSGREGGGAGVREHAVCVRPRARHELRGLGRLLGRSREHRQARSRARRGRDSRHEPVEGRRTGARARGPSGKRAAGAFRQRRRRRSGA